MRTAALIIVDDKGKDPTAELYGISPVELLSTTLFLSGIDRVVVAGSAKMMDLVNENCTKLFLEFIFITKKNPDYLIKAVEYLNSISDRIIIIPAEYSFINQETVTSLINSKEQAAVAVCDGTRSNIFAVDVSVFAEFIENGGSLSKLHTEATPIECNHIGAISSINDESVDIKRLYDEFELVNELRPIVRITLGRDKSTFGPGVVQIFRLIHEIGSINKARAVIGLGYKKYLQMHERFTAALGEDPLESEGENHMTRIRCLTPKALEFIEKYEQYEKEVKTLANELFYKSFSGFFNE